MMFCTFDLRSKTRIEKQKIDDFIFIQILSENELQ